MHQSVPPIRRILVGLYQIVHGEFVDQLILPELFVVTERVFELLYVPSDPGTPLTETVWFTFEIIKLRVTEVAAE